MNGSSAINEQLIGKFHVISVDKIGGNNHTDDIIPQISAIPDETGCASRFQMIRVDRNFGRGRWKVNDYEPPENTSISANLPVNTIENEPINNSNISTTVLATMPTVITGDSNTTSSAALTVTAATAAAAAAAAFQQRMGLNNPPTVLPTTNVPPPTSLLHGFPPTAMTNQPYLLPNHHQFGYYPYFPPPYGPYAAQWAAAAAAALNHYLPPHTLAPTANLNDPTIRHSDTDINGETSTTFPNSAADHVQNAQLSFLYAAPYSHASFVPHVSSTTSSYATIPSYHPVPPPPTIIPPQTLPLSQTIPNYTNDIQQSHQVPQLTSPKTDLTKVFSQQSSTPKPKPVNGINNDLSKPTIATTQSSLNSPTTSLNNIWPYTTNVTSLNLTQTAQTAAATAVAAMGLLNNENNQNTEIANEILKELTTPTKQNNFTLLERRACLRLRRQLSTTDIDNKISAAMDLVKMHLLSAVREEVTELRQQIRILNEKVNSTEHENAFLRQHVSSEIYAQYIPAFIGSSSSNDSTTTTLSSSSQPIPINSLSSTQQSTLSTNNL